MTARAILMGDPGFFRIKTGGNPHTRNRWGLRKTINAQKARQQWERAVATFRDYGLQVEIVPAGQSAPGLVFPANAGFLLEKEEKLPPNQKHFYLSNLLPGRAAEKEIYRRYLEGLGFQVREFPDAIRFEGEADFFPAGEGYILTYGVVQRQRWAPALGIPPYKRIYGFRTDMAILPYLQALAPGKKIIALELAQEAYYHGDTVACAMGKNLEHLMVYPEGVTAASMERLKKDFAGNLLALSQSDAKRFAANSFYVNAGTDQFLFCPAGLSDGFLGMVRGLGIQTVPVDVSEFFSKGGGSVKCMLCDLGVVL